MLDNNTTNLEELGKQYIAFKKKRNKKQSEYTRKRYKTDIVFKRKHRLRIAVSTAIATYNRRPIQKGLPYTVKELIEHIEKQFTPEMTWKNHSIYWEIDHIRPLRLANTEEEVFSLFQLANLRPLAKKVNRHSDFL